MREFLRGGDVNLWLDGRKLCAVTSVECSQLDEYEDIREFLSEKPVVRLAVPKYEIAIEVCVTDLDSIKGLSKTRTIELSGDKTTVKYEGCTPLSVVTRALPDKAVGCTLKFSAEKRSEQVGQLGEDC